MHGCAKICSLLRSLPKNEPGGRRNNGLLQPLPIPDRPWQDISMDLITGLPLTANGFDAIFTFVDRLSKSVHLCPTSATIDAAGAANLYIQNVFRLHGLSCSIVCDRDPRFTADFSSWYFPDWVASLNSAQLTTLKQTGKVKERIELLVTFCDLSSTIGRTIATTIFRSVSLRSMICYRNRPRRLL